MAGDQPLRTKQVPRAQVVRVSGDGRFQNFNRWRVPGRRTEGKACTRADGAIVSGQIGRQCVDQRFGFGRGTGPEQRKRQVELEFGLVWFRLDRLAQCHDFGMRIERGDRRRVRCFVGRNAGLDAVLLQQFAKLALRHRAGKAIDDLACP